ncbi:MAG: DUF3842 family protein [Lachnospiraceae bacterium]|nr:DUF3842 family protein [Lachnospiraceae bacterium]
MNVLIIDGQGGQLGVQLIKALNMKYQDLNITAVGTNATATTAMVKAGASQGATGENPVIVACRKADVIIGPIGIVITDSFLGEVTEKMAVAVGRSDAIRILIPVNKCDNIIAGVGEIKMSNLVEDVLKRMDYVMKKVCSV